MMILQLMITIATEVINIKGNINIHHPCTNYFKTTKINGRIKTNARGNPSKTDRPQIPPPPIPPMSSPPPLQYLAPPFPPMPSPPPPFLRISGYCLTPLANTSACGRASTRVLLTSAESYLPLMGPTDSCLALLSEVQTTAVQQ